MTYDKASQLFNALRFGVQVKHFATGADYVQFLGMKRKLTSYITELDKDVSELITEYNSEWSNKVEKIQKKEVKTKKDEELLKTPPVKVNEQNIIECSDPSFFDKVKAIREKDVKVDLNFITDAAAFKSIFEGCPTEAQDILFEFLFKA